MIKGVSKAGFALREAEKAATKLALILSAFDVVQQRDGLEAAKAHVDEKFPNMQFDSEYLAKVEKDLADAYAEMTAILGQGRSILKRNNM